MVILAGAARPAPPQKGGETVARMVIAIIALILVGIAFGSAGTCVIAFIALRKEEKEVNRMKYHTKVVRHAPMDHIEKQETAKKIAALLAESAATVDDMFDVFQLVREYLVVTPRIPEGKSYGFTVLDQTRDDDGIGDK